MEWEWVVTEVVAEVVLLLARKGPESTIVVSDARFATTTGEKRIRYKGISQVSLTWDSTR